MEIATQSLFDLSQNTVLQEILAAFARSIAVLQSNFETTVAIESIIRFFLLAVIVLIGGGLIILGHKLFLVYLQLKPIFTFLEVKPPQQTLQSSYTTQQLFTLLHGLAQQRSWWQRLIGNQKNYSFEIVSTKDEGIRYLLRVHEEDADLIKKGLLSYLPGMSITIINDYLPKNLDQRKSLIAEF